MYNYFTPNYFGSVAKEIVHILEMEVGVALEEINVRVALGNISVAVIAEEINTLSKTGKDDISIDTEEFVIGIDT